MSGLKKLFRKNVDVQEAAVPNSSWNARNHYSGEDGSDEDGGLYEALDPAEETFDPPISPGVEHEWSDNEFDDDEDIYLNDSEVLTGRFAAPPVVPKVEEQPTLPPRTWKQQRDHEQSLPTRPTRDCLTAQRKSPQPPALPDCRISNRNNRREVSSEDNDDDDDDDSESYEEITEDVIARKLKAALKKRQIVVSEPSAEEEEEEEYEVADDTLHKDTSRSKSSAMPAQKFVAPEPSVPSLPSRANRPCPPVPIDNGSGGATVQSTRQQETYVDSDRYPASTKTSFVNRMKSFMKPAVRPAPIPEPVESPDTYEIEDPSEPFQKKFFNPLSKPLPTAPSITNRNQRLPRPPSTESEDENICIQGASDDDDTSSRCLIPPLKPVAKGRPSDGKQKILPGKQPLQKQELLPPDRKHRQVPYTPVQPKGREPVESPSFLQCKVDNNNNSSSSSSNRFDSRQPSRQSPSRSKNWTKDSNGLNDQIDAKADSKKDFKAAKSNYPKHIPPKAGLKPEPDNSETSTSRRSKGNYPKHVPPHLAPQKLETATKQTDEAPKNDFAAEANKGKIAKWPASAKEDPETGGRTWTKGNEGVCSNRQKINLNIDLGLKPKPRTPDIPSKPLLKSPKPIVPVKPKSPSQSALEEKSNGKDGMESNVSHLKNIFEQRTSSPSTRRDNITTSANNNTNTSSIGRRSNNNDNSVEPGTPTDVNKNIFLKTTLRKTSPAVKGESAEREKEIKKIKEKADEKAEFKNSLVESIGKMRNGKIKSQMSEAEEAKISADDDRPKSKTPAIFAQRSTAPKMSAFPTRTADPSKQKFVARSKDPLQDCPWYLPDVTREDGANKLKAIGRNGAFLIRKSQRGASLTPYSLSLLQDGRIFNLQIRKRSDNTYAIGSEKADEQSFVGVEEMVLFYSATPIEIMSDTKKQAYLRHPAGSK